MPVGNELQEMENVVNKNAAAAEPMHKGPQGAATPGQAEVEDLGGPTPENYKVDDNSAKLNTPGKTLKQVRDVVNAKATPGDQAMPTMKKEEEERLRKEEEILKKEEEERLRKEEEERLKKEEEDERLKKKKEEESLNKDEEEERVKK